MSSATLSLIGLADRGRVVLVEVELEAGLVRERLEHRLDPLVRDRVLGVVDDRKERAGL